MGLWNIFYFQLSINYFFFFMKQKLLFNPLGIISNWFIITLQPWFSETTKAIGSDTNSIGISFQDNNYDFIEQSFGF